jgi:hypothetical protein
MSDHKREDELDRIAGLITDGETVDWERSEGHPNLRLIDSIGRAHAAFREGDPEFPLQRWKHLVIRESIARGGFGEVFRAYDPRLDQEVALKLLPTQKDSLLGHVEFVEEARRLARVRHPNVVTVHGVDTDRGRTGIWMELLEGRTLADLVDAQGAFDADETVVIGLQICGALAAVHEAGLIHRDVKLANLVRREGGGIVLTDFGSATRRTGVRSIDGISGTPMYLAPEIFECEDSGIRVDIYSLGVVLYRLSSGRYPLESGDAASLHRQHREGRRVPLRDANPKLPAPFVQVAEQAMDPDPLKRFQSAGEMERALAGTKRSSEPAAPSKSSKRSLMFGLPIVIALGLLAFMFWPRPLQAEATYYRWDADRQTREELTQGSLVRPGDKLFLEMEADEPLWVYVITADARGREYRLFPLDVLDLTNPVDSGALQQIPGPVDRVEQFWDVTSVGGEETIMTVVSRRKLEQLEAAIENLPQAGARTIPDVQDQAVLHQMRGIGGLSPAPPVPVLSDEKPGSLIGRQFSLRVGETRDAKAWELRLRNPG